MHILKHTCVGINVYSVSIDNVPGLVVCKRKQNAQNYRLCLHPRPLFISHHFFWSFLRVPFLWYVFKCNIRQRVRAESRGVTLDCCQP